MTNNDRPIRGEAASSDAADPILRRSMREAIVVMVVWLAVTSWCTAYCTRFGYGRDFDEVRFIVGVPDWVLFGIVAPWGVCLLISWWFAYRFMTDQPLGMQREAESKSVSDRDDK